MSATPGWDFGKQGTTHGTSVSGHGSLHATHLRVPFLMNRPFDTTAVRTVDAAPTIVQLMGEEPLKACDGVSLVARRTGTGKRQIPDGLPTPRS